MKLTQEQKRVKLAEACGYEPTKTPSGVCWYNPNAEICSDGHVLWDVEELPDYFNDLNACHEAEKVLTLEQSTQYVNVLWPQGYAPLQAVHAAAPQRAEALGQTLNLWEAGE